MPETVCPLCDGTGWRVVERNGLSGATRCTCMEISRSAGLMRSADIPPNYRDSTFDNFQPLNDNPVARQRMVGVLTWVRRYVAEFPTENKPGLLLVGDTGTGKTHLAIAMLRAIIERGYEGVFFDYQNLLDRIRSGYDRAAGAADKEAYRSAMDADVLLLDDLGSHRVTEWVEDTVTSIITYRCNHKKPLIATTNLSMEEVVGYTTPGGTQVHQKTLRDAIGVRARSRISEMCRIVNMTGIPDYRMRRGIAG